MGTGTLFVPLSLLHSFLLFYFSASQVSSASSPPPPVQTGTDLPLNAFSWASPAPDIVGLFGCSRGPRHRAATGATAVKWAVSMHTVDEVVVLLGGGVPAAIDEAAVKTGAGLIPCD